MKYFKLLLPVLLLLVVSCTTIRPVFMLPSGQPIADPTYVLTDTGNSRLQLTFHATVYTTVIDKDDSVVYIPQTIDIDKVHTLTNNVQKITITAEVFNPNNVEYSFDYDVITKSFVHGTATTTYTPVKAAKSNLPYRMYTFDMPFNESLITGEFKGKIKINDLTVFMVGPFDYKKERFEDFE